MTNRNKATAAVVVVDDEDDEEAEAAAAAAADAAMDDDDERLKYELRRVGAYGDEAPPVPVPGPVKEAISSSTSVLEVVGRLIDWCERVCCSKFGCWLSLSSQKHPDLRLFGG